MKNSFMQSFFIVKDFYFKSTMAEQELYEFTLYRKNLDKHYIF